MSRCFYCAKEYSGTQEPEHVLPAAIGAELTTGRVHSACNRRAGVEVDQPWLADPFVVDARRRFAVPDRRGRLRGALNFKGRIVGHHDDAIVTLDGETVTVRPVPAVSLDGNVMTLKGYTDDELDAKLARLRRSNPNYVVLSSERSDVGHLSAEVTIEMSVDTWPRFAAKVALGIASIIVEDEGWLDTSAARLLIEVLWSGHPDTRAAEGIGVRGVAWSPAPRPVDTILVRPPEHLVAFEQRPDEPGQLVMVLFGDLGYQLPLELDWTTSPGGLPMSCWFGDGWNRGRWYPTPVQYQVLRLRHAPDGQT